MNSEYCLEKKNSNKTIPGVKALDNANFKLKKGNILSFDNRRVAHGRTEYNSNSGQRHLQGYYMDRDEIQSRLNYLKKIEL